MIKYAPKTEPVSKKHVKILENFWILTRYGSVMVPEGFIYDGASAPWLSVFLLRLGRHGPRMLGPTAAHDFLYRAKEFDGRKFTQKEADTVYYDMLLSNGVKKYKCKTHYSVLRKLGGKAWANQPDKFKLDPR